ncbi:lipocalin-like domain-containing protein [Pontibacter russatus]|uniref:lipocalin-like domain-containing protein n=1 Tax=Pontibacter russatus TaxID=2694929 RepID=UPI00137B87A5|nr:DUF5004 domain-containing protein [Pontibacter russatus]
MRNLRLIALLLVTLFSLSLSSCKDDDDSEDMSPKTALLTEKEWTGEGIYVQGTSLALLLQLAGEEDLAEQFNISSTKIKFEKDGTFTGTSNGVMDSGKWKFTDNEQKIVITNADNQETTFKVNSLTESNLNLELNVEDLGMEPVEFQGVTINTVELRFVR